MKWNIFFTILIVICSFSIYLITLSPTVYTGDCGELIASSYTLGIAHPPGYPLFSIIGKFFILFFPIANIAYRVNLMCSIFSSITVLLLYLFFLYLITLQFRNPHSKLATHIVAFSASLCFAFSRTFWSQSVDAEVYALNALFVVLIFYILIKSLSSSNNIYYYLLSFIYGLSLTNHQSMILFAPIFALVVILRVKNQSRFVKPMVLMLLLFFFGLSIYIFLPIRSFASPSINWGNPDTFGNLMSHVLRRQYGNISKIPRSFSTFYQQLIVYYKFLVIQFTPFFIPLILIGIIYSIKKWLSFFIISIITYLILSVGVIYILNFELTAEIADVVEVFFIPSHIILGIWFGIGILGFVKLFKGKFAKLYPLVVIFPLIICTFNYSSNNRSNNFFARDYGLNILNTLEEKAVLFTKGDNQIFPIAYFYMVEKERNDLSIYDDYGYVFPNIYGNDYHELTTAQQDTRRTQTQVSFARTSRIPVYYTAASSLSLPAEIDAEGIGMIYRIKRLGEYSKGYSYPWKIYLTRNLYDKNIFQDYLTRNIVAQYHYFLGKYHYFKKDLERARLEFGNASNTGYDMESMFNNLAVAYYEMADYENSIKEFKKAIQINPNKSEIHWNLGTVYLSMGRFDEAIKKYEDTIKLKINYPDAYVKMGIAYYRKGMLKRAIEETKKALIFDPAHPESLKNLELYNKELGGK